MKEEKRSSEKKTDKKPVTYTSVDWNSYKIKKEEKGVGSGKRESSEWTQPEVDEKWILDRENDARHAYDFAADEAFNKALKEADSRTGKKTESPDADMKPSDKAADDMKEIKAEEIPADSSEKQSQKKTEKRTEKQTDRHEDKPVEKQEDKQNKETPAKSRKKKSLGTKLDELGSSWVSTGNFRNKDEIDNKTIKDLENNIIETTKGASDDFLTKAVAEVSSALRDEDGYEPLGEVSLGDTFEIPKLDIHFGDTQDLKDAKKDLKEIRSEDLKKEIEKLDLAADADAQKKERKKKKEAAENDNAEKIIVKSDELKRKRKKKTAVSDKNEAAEDKTDAMNQFDQEKKTDEPAKKRKKKAVSESDSTASAERKKKEAKPAAAGKKKKSPQAGESRKGTGSKNRKKPVSEKEEKPAVKRSERRKVTGKTEEPQDAKEIPAKTGKTKKTGPSEFRKKSADWKDKKTIEKTAKTVSFAERKKQLTERIKKVTPIQWGIAAMGVIIFITGIMTTAAYANYQGEENKALALKSLGRYTEDESYSAVASEVTEEMIPEAAQEPEPEQARALSLEMSSVEKDLKIKLVDDEDSLVKDVSWSVTVSEDKGDDSVSDDGEVYEDDDMDGTIYIENIAAGDYSVTLNPSDSLADYILPKEKQLVSVKASIEYKVIANIKDEIKSEKEVNVALEDPNGNQAADVEVAAPANTDTVEWFESTKEANGDEYVEATPDLSKTASAAKKSTGFLAALRQLGKGTRYTGIKKTTLGFTLPTGYLVATEEGQDTTSIVKAEDSDNNQENSQENNQGNNQENDQNNNQNNNNTDITVTEPEQNVVTDDVVVEPTSAPSQPVEEASLSISGSSTVVVGSSVNITATYKPDNSTVTWSVSDSSIASLTDNGSNCQVTGVKAGEVTLTISCSNGKETTMKITVTEKEAQYSDDAKLYDASKNALYVKDGDEYRLATYGDYKSGNYSTYYRKQESFLYTGWQDIDGHTYYYLGDHTYVTGEQIIQGIKYNFGSDGALSKGSGTLGIDVSKYQPSINWASVKASGVSYVIIRCGYRGASTGVLIQDPYFTSHIKGAKAAGLKVGVYFFTTALNETEAVEEASMCAALCSGYGINYPIFMDCESSSRPGYNELSSSERTAIIKAFCNTIKSAGYTPGVYANKTWLSSKMNTSSLSGAKIWLAQYNPAGPTYSGRYDLWQYTSKGHVDGISGNVDMNQSYLGY